MYHLRGSCWKPYYEIYDENHSAVLKLDGPCCICDGNSEIEKFRDSEIKKFY